MILADENIDQRIIQAIRNIGIEVVSIYETNRGITDEEIITFSKIPPRIILTEDKDFGEWVFAHHIKDISVIFLRYNFKETSEIVKLLCKLLEKNVVDFLSQFTTVTTKKTRRREI